MPTASNENAEGGRMFSHSFLDRIQIKPMFDVCSTSGVFSHQILTFELEENHKNVCDHLVSNYGLSTENGGPTEIIGTAGEERT